MKKYLITGALALVACATLTSCHSDDELSGSLIEQKLQTYEQVFKQEFGEVNPNQDWGFGAPASARTRAENANANEWADPNKDYGGLNVPPPLTDAQIAVVKKYFQITRNIPYQDPQWTNYFIQQVYKGHTDPKTGTDPNTGKPYSPEAYMAANGTTYLYASDYMDHLAAIDPNKADPETGQTPFVDHINNFNHGDCGENDHVLDKGGNANDGPFHTDKIMYMQNSTTKSFGYFNSNGSLCHTEYTGLVSYKTIMQALGAEADCLNDGWNRSFMGFDFEQMIDDQCYATDGSGVVKNLTINEYSLEYYVNGEKTSNYVYQYNNQPVKMLSDQMNRYCADVIDVTDDQLYSDYRVNGEYLGKQLNTDFIDDLLEDGYLPVDNKSLRVWAKVGGCADGYYSDWIVTLTEANAPGTITIPIENEESSNYIKRTYRQYRLRTDFVQCGRIMCEDLGTSSISDIDFNDIVFDAWMYNMVQEIRTKIVKVENNNETTLVDWSDWAEDLSYYGQYGYTTTDVYLLAGGGTIPVTIAGVPFKNAFNIDDKVIVNTVDDREESNIKRYGNHTLNWQQPDGLKDMRKLSSFNDIEVIVLYNNTPIPLVSEQGKVPHKICVPIKTKWPYERIVINEAYDFNDYVKNGSSVSYVGNNANPIYNSKNEIIGYYLDEYENDVWTKAPDDVNKNETDSRYHGGINDEDDITGIPYKNDARVIGSYTKPVDLGYNSEEDEVISSSNGGYQEGDEVLIRRRH